MKKNSSILYGTTQFYTQSHHRHPPISKSVFRLKNTSIELKITNIVTHTPGRSLHSFICLAGGALRSVFAVVRLRFVFNCFYYREVFSTVRLQLLLPYSFYFAAVRLRFYSIRSVFAAVRLQFLCRFSFSFYFCEVVVFFMCSVFCFC